MTITFRSGSIALVLLAGSAVLSAAWDAAEPAQACGVKLTVKSPKINNLSRSNNPSTILVLGEPDSRLARDLRSAGHTVEQATTPDRAKGSDYRVVIVDASRMDEAAQRYPDSLVVERRKSARGSVRLVERRLARAPSRRSGGDLLARAVVNRQPIARGPDSVDQGRSPIERGTGENSDSVGSPQGESPPRASIEVGGDVAVATKAVPKEPEPKGKQPKQTEPKGKEPKTEPEPTVESDTGDSLPGKWSRELYFNTGSNALGAGSKKRLRANVRWLKENPNAALTIEGHTDTVGTTENNQQLGQRRAEAAKTFLVGLGIEESRISTVSKGEDEPAYSPGTSAKNRRVVLVKEE